MSSQIPDKVMDPRARKALLRLLKAANKHHAGTAVRRPALAAAALSEYHALRGLKAMEDFEAEMATAQAMGAITVHRPRRDRQGLIERIELVDIVKLASHLGEVPYAVQVQAARQALDTYLSRYPVLTDVLSTWDKLKTVRGSGPDVVHRWVMACDVIAYCTAEVARGATETAVRDASARLFRDSKRIEALIPYLDVLLTGSTDEEARPEAEVLQELGLYREPQPVRLAGNIVVRRERGAFLLDRPYTALPPTTVLGLGDPPGQVLTIENQTTFHGWARQHSESDVLCLYTAGMPSPAWRAMYLRLLTDLPPSTPVLHWGDLDEGGFRIAAFLSRCVSEAGHVLLPWRMRPADIPEPLRRSARPRTVDRMVKYAREAGWNELALELSQAKLVAEQEG